MRITLLLLLCIAIAAASQKEYALRLAHGEVTQSSYGEILSAQIRGNPERSSVYALDGSYLLQKNLFDLPLELYISTGLAYFDEGVERDNLYEVTLYLKLYYTLSLKRAKIRFGFGEGGSYTDKILAVELAEAREINGNTSHYLNYLDTSVDANLGALFDNNELKYTTIGLLIKHRSGIFGLINNVTRGGSNYNCIYIEQQF